MEENVFWTHACPLEGAPRDVMLAAAKCAWPYARRSAWSYLNDETLAAELLERAIEQVSPYLTRSISLPSSTKVNARLRSQVRRLAQQEAHRRRFEEYKGNSFELELISPAAATSFDDAIFLEQFLRLLSPHGRTIAQALRLGLTWREIARNFNTDHSTVRRAFRREADLALSRLQYPRPER